MANACLPLVWRLQIIVRICCPSFHLSRLYLCASRFDIFACIIPGSLEAVRVLRIRAPGFRRTIPRFITSIAPNESAKGHVEDRRSRRRQFIVMKNLEWVEDKPWRETDMPESTQGGCA